MLPHYTPAKAKELGLDRFQARSFADLHILQRNGPPVPVINTHLERFQWRPWDPPDTGGGRPPALSDKDVVSALRRLGQVSKSTLSTDLGVARSTLDARLDRLEQVGIVTLSTGARGALIVDLNEEELPS